MNTQRTMQRELTYRVSLDMPERLVDGDRLLQLVFDGTVHDGLRTKLTLVHMINHLFNRRIYFLLNRDHAPFRTQAVESLPNPSGSV